jgi:hypothetical protein
MTSTTGERRTRMTARAHLGITLSVAVGLLVAALDRSTGAIVYRHQLPTSSNAPIAVFGNTVLVPAGGPHTSASGSGGNPQLVAYTVP